MAIATKLDATPEQQAIINSWSQPPSTIYLFQIRNSEVVALERFIYTVGISVLSCPVTRQRRYCYHSLAEALGALADWMQDLEAEHPHGFIKMK